MPELPVWGRKLKPEQGQEGSGSLPPYITREFIQNLWGFCLEFIGSLLWICFRVCREFPGNPLGYLLAICWESIGNLFEIHSDFLEIN